MYFQPSSFFQTKVLIQSKYNYMLCHFHTGEVISSYDWTRFQPGREGLSEAHASHGAVLPNGPRLHLHCLRRDHAQITRPCPRRPGVEEEDGEQQPCHFVRICYSLIFLYNHIVFFSYKPTWPRLFTAQGLQYFLTICSSYINAQSWSSFYRVLWERRSLSSNIWSRKEQRNLRRSNSP